MANLLRFLVCFAVGQFSWALATLRINTVQAGSASATAIIVGLEEVLSIAVMWLAVRRGSVWGAIAYILGGMYGAWLAVSWGWMR